MIDNVAGHRLVVSSAINGVKELVCECGYTKVLRATTLSEDRLAALEHVLHAVSERLADTERVAGMMRSIGLLTNLG